MKPSAKSLILELLVASNGEPLQAREAIRACQLFGISANNVRVALARLSAESLIAGAGRGSYRLGTEALQLSGELATWRSVEASLRPWNGDYLMVACAGLGRTDRLALRRRERALQMLGFQALDKGLHIRPNNIEADSDAVRQRLLNLGLEAEALVFVGARFEAQQEARIRQLWDGQALTAGYLQTSRQLDAWRHRASELEPDVAAREVFLLGSRAIRQVRFDPLLPEPMVDTAARQAFIECVQRFVEQGQQIWRGLFDSAQALPETPQRPAAGRVH
ncbi:MAG: PaaX family transcriptional regulator C-terminal domain-containing protein [Pseudomonas sp.]